MSLHLRDTRVLLCCSAASILAVPAAQAQSQPTPPAPAPAPNAAQNDATSSTDADDFGIVVTAQRRTERLQDVPISASVIGGDILSQKNITSLESLTQQTPAVVVTKGGAANRLSIRGIGSGDNNPLFEQSVATFVDNVYQGRSRSSGSTFLDLARVEILKGPQSIYFGNNSIAGVLNLVSNDPGDTLEGYVRGAYNFTFNSTTVEGAVGGPVTDTLGVRVAGIADFGNGYLHDESVGLRVPHERSYAGRVTLKWEPTSDINWTVKVSGDHRRQKGAIADEIVYCPPDPIFSGGAAGNCAAALALGEDVVLNQRRSHSKGQGIRADSYFAVSNLDYDAGPLQFSAITGYAHSKYTQNLDVDGTSEVRTHFTTPERFTQFSQELRVATPRENPLAFDAGVYYQHEKIDGGVNYNFAVLNSRLTGPFAPLADQGYFSAFDAYRQATQSYAAYLFFTTKPLDSLTLSFGGRQTWVDKSIRLDQGFGYTAGAFGDLLPYPTPELQALADTFGSAAGLGLIGERRASRSDTHFAPSVVLSYEPNNNVHVYAKYTNGFKAGGFNGLEHTGVPGSLTFGPEYVDGYEVGLKTNLFDHHLNLNLALFRNDFDDLQVSVSQNFGTATVNVIGNASGARAQGIEVESRYHLNSNLSAGLSFTLLDSKYTRYRNAGGSAVDVELGHPLVDLSGAPTRYAPDYSGNFDVDYVVPVGSSLELHFNGNVYFTDDYNFSNNNDPFLEQKAYARLGAIVGIGDADGKWDISLIGKNLTDKTIRIFGTNLPQSLGSYLIGTDEPLSVAIQGRVNF